MTHSIDRLRRRARILAREAELGDAAALQRIRMVRPRAESAALKHADYLHVIAREEGFATWPALKLAVETHGMDRAAQVQRLKIAVAHGQGEVVARLLGDTPDLAEGEPGLQIALYEREAVAALLAADSGLATRALGNGTALIALCQSRMIHLWPEKSQDMLAIAEMLLGAGADVNRGQPSGEGHALSPLYFALGHADNMALSRWLLEHGADPNDNESLYHSTELGHHEGLKMLLDHGADPQGTNALLRAMDFDDVEAVRMLLAAGADPNEFDNREIGGEAPWVIPALHQAARRAVSEEMAQVLLEAGADPNRRYLGTLPHAYARVFGNAPLARLLAEAGAETTMTEEERLLAGAAEGREAEGRWIDPAKISPAYRNILREILHLPGRLPQLKALVALGVEHDRPDDQGLTPVQAAGWSGLPEVMGWLLEQRPDLTHVNNYGGTLLSTIIHGSENAPEREARDHVGCARLALEHGVALPRRAVDLAGAPEMAEFLADWAERYPGQVVAEGLA